MEDSKQMPVLNVARKIVRDSGINLTGLTKRGPMQNVAWLRGICGADVCLIRMGDYIYKTDKELYSFVKGYLEVINQKKERI